MHLTLTNQGSLTAGQLLILISAFLHSHWALMQKGQCQSFLGRVPTRLNARRNALQPPPCVTQITARCLPLVRVELRFLRWNFHILFSTETSDRRVSQSALRNSVARPIRSSEPRDVGDLFGSSVYSTAQHFLWKSWDRTTDRLYRERLQLLNLTVSNVCLVGIVFIKWRMKTYFCLGCSFEIRGADKLLPALTRPRSQVTF